MTNNKQHQSNRCIFVSQADTSYEQNIPTPGLILAVAPAQNEAPAGATNRTLLDADNLDISRDSVRLPAQSKTERPDQPRNHDTRVVWKQGSGTDTASSHNRRVKRGLEQGILSSASSRTNIPHPDTGTHTQISGNPNTGEALQQTDSDPTSQRLIERPRCGVWQDKAREGRAREASLQPAADNEITRSQEKNINVDRLQTHNVAKQKLVQVTLWVDPAVKEHLVRLALAEGLSVSAAGAAFLRSALQQSIDLEYSALLEPIIEHAIAKHMRGISTRLAWLLVRVSIDSGQTRSLVTNILGRQTGMTTDLLRSIVKQSADTARGNITRKTPQLEDLVESVEKWLNTRERGENN